MEFNEFSNEIKVKMNNINIKINETQIEQFYNYMNLLIEWNEKINLTAITDPKEIIVKHFVDCATIVNEVNGRVLDIGTGAGFPGIPLKILNPTLDITLVDSLNKRVNFLNKVIEELKLDKIEAIHSRAEELGKNIKYREKFDVVASRAVAQINILAEYTLPFCKKGGKCIFMKGANVEQELKNGEKSIKILGGKIEKINELFLENNDNNRKIIIIDKLNSTPIKYPRKPGTPTKEPIK